jgi:PST family polysaccharide transporter
MQWLRIEAANTAALASGGMVALALAWWGWPGTMVLVAQALITASVNAFACFALCPWRPHGGPCGALLPDGRRQGRAIAGLGLIDYAQRQLDDAMVGWSAGAAALGLYGRAHALLMIPLQVVTGAINAAMIPLLSRLHHQPALWRRSF